MWGSLASKVMRGWTSAVAQALSRRERSPVPIGEADEGLIGRSLNGDRGSLRPGDRSSCATRAATAVRDVGQLGQGVIAACHRSSAWLARKRCWRARCPQGDSACHRLVFERVVS